MMTSKKDQIEKKEDLGRDVIEIISNERLVSREKRIVIPKQALNTIDDNELLQGKTLQVYWYLLENNEAGIREIQKGLNFSSPGLVAYQINKLIKAGIIAKDEITDKYFINQKVQPGILSFYINRITVVYSTK